MDVNGSASCIQNRMKSWPQGSGVRRVRDFGCAESRDVCSEGRSSMAVMDGIKNSKGDTVCKWKLYTYPIRGSADPVKKNCDFMTQSCFPLLRIIRELYDSKT